MRPTGSPGENTAEVVAIIDASGTILNLSTAGVAVFGYPPQELVGRNIVDLVHPKGRTDSLEALRKVHSRPLNPLTREVLVQHKNGRRCFTACTISSLPEPYGAGAMVVYCRDISVQRAAKNLEKRHFRELLRANRRLEDLAYAVAHDLRESFRTVAAFTEILSQETAINSPSQELAQFILAGVVRMSSVFEDLHSSATRGFERAAEAVNLNRVLAEVLQSLRHIITTSGAVVTAAPLPLVQGNDKQLMRIFQNLIVNAIKYRSDSPIKIHIHAVRHKPDWMIKVTDNGIGVAKADHERIFRLLNRLHGPELPGAGIGLAICKKLVEAMGGTIWVESDAGAGATFCFMLTAALADQDSTVMDSYLPASAISGLPPLLQAPGMAKGAAN